MARPIKKGLSYFPLDTRFWGDRKTQRLKQRYGCDGICVYLAILCEIYGKNGYYAGYDGDFRFDIAFTTGVDERLTGEIVDYCVQIRLFDARLLRERRILTSAGIQERFEEICKRTSVRIDPSLCLLGTEEGVSAAETAANATETPVSATKTPVNKNKNKNKNKHLLRDENHEYNASTDYGESVRRAELARMATEATAGRG